MVERTRSLTLTTSRTPKRFQIAVFGGLALVLLPVPLSWLWLRFIC